MKCRCYQKALQRRESMTYSVKTLEEMIEAAENRPGFIKADWCGERECEDALKEKAGVSSRCIPLSGNEMLTGKCVCCGKDAQHMVCWGIAY